MKLSTASLSAKEMEEIMNLVTKEMDIFPMVLSKYILIQFHISRQQQRIKYALSC